MGSVEREGFSLANVLRDLVRERPDHEALAGGKRRLTFAQLDERSSRVGNALIAAGVAPSDRVAVLVKNGVEFFEVAYGASQVDAMLVALNWRLSAPELRAIFEDAQPSVLIFDPESAGRCPRRTPD